MKLLSIAILASALVACAIPHAANASVIASYDFDGVAPEASMASEISGVTPSDLSINAGVSWTGTIGANPDGLYSNNVLQTIINTGPQTIETAIANGAFWSFTVAIDNSKTIDLTSLDLDAALGGTGGRAFVIRSDKTGSTNLADFDRSFNNETGSLAPLSQRPTLTSRSVTLTDPALKGLTDTSVTFLVYEYAGSGGREFDFDNVVLNAEVVPEPASVVLLAAALLVPSLRRRQR